MLAQASFAEMTPIPGVEDERVRVVDYSAGNVFRIITWYGVSTDIQFGEGESIRHISMGDEKAWAVEGSGNLLSVKPTATKADTNMRVVTDKRSYHFALIVKRGDQRNEKAWEDKALIWSLTFRYPQEEAAKLQAMAEAGRTQARARDVNEKLAAAKQVISNTDYWVAGSDLVSPTAARDDGHFIHLTFSGNRDMPAVYSVDDAGQESLINTNVDGNTIIVHRLVRKLVLRKGNEVACIVNQSFNLNGADNTSGTVAPGVERVIKGPR